MTPSFDLAALTEIPLSDSVGIDLHPGAGGVRWATLHTGPNATEIGTVHTVADLDAVLTIAAAVLMERPHHVDGIWVSPDRTQRWVLIGEWVLTARMGSAPGHMHMATAEQAQAVFTLRSRGAA
jgi:hypothetical protein